MRIPSIALMVCAVMPWASASAQSPTVVSPARAVSTLGPRFHGYPLSVAPFKYQQVHSASSFTIASPRSVHLLRVRPRYTPSPGWVDISIRIADCPHDANSASDFYALNVTPGTESLVFTRKVLNLPVPASVGWTLTLPFDTPFSWSGSHLSWTAETFGASGGAGYAVDAWHRYGLVTHDPKTGCASALATELPYLVAMIPPPGGTATFSAFSQVNTAGLSTALLLGLSAVSVDLTPFGATGCSLATDPLAVAFGVTSASSSGPAHFMFPVPNHPGLAGAVLHAQAAFAQPGANPLGVFVTGGAECEIGQAPGVTRLFGFPSNSYGYLDPMFGISIALD